MAETGRTAHDRKRVKSEDEVSYWSRLFGVAPERVSRTRPPGQLGAIASEPDQGTIGRPRAQKPGQAI
jgi:hypothetical protein